MKVLLVCAFKEGLAENVAPFVLEQKNALQRCGIECEWFLVQGRGVIGYLKQLRPLKKKMAVFHPDVVHAHYGLCGLLANLQRKVPVVTTYHGTDVNNPKVLLFSRMAMRLSTWNIFVSRITMEKAKCLKKATLLPCGVDLNELQQTAKKEARQRMGLSQEKKYVLFAGAFDNAVKNASLAKEVIALLNDDRVELIELKGYSREEVTLLMCAVDVFLMTSVSEGSPQVIKEALACGCPIVSVDVGDVRERTEGVEGCFVALSRNPKELADLLGRAMAFKGKTDGRRKIVEDGLENKQIAENLIKIYKSII